VVGAQPDARVVDIDLRHERAVNAGAHVKEAGGATCGARRNVDGGGNQREDADR
jgi:hypothetical protein